MKAAVRHSPARGTQPRSPRHARRRGIALPAMIFALVIVGLMLGAGLALLTQSTHSQNLQLQEARALAAAKSGAEWGLWKVSDPDGAQNLGATTLPVCFGNNTAVSLPSPLDDVTVTVNCTRDPSNGTVDEGGLKLASYSVSAKATVGDSGSVNNQFVQRTFEARVTVCKNPGGTAPRYAC